MLIWPLRHVADPNRKKRKLVKKKLNLPVLRAFCRFFNYLIIYLSFRPPSQPIKSCLRKNRLTPSSSDGTSQSDFSEEIMSPVLDQTLEPGDKFMIEELDEKIETVRSRHNLNRRTINLRERHVNIHNMFHMSVSFFLKIFF